MVSGKLRWGQVNRIDGPQHFKRGMLAKMSTISLKGPENYSKFKWASMATARRLESAAHRVSLILSSGDSGKGRMTQEGVSSALWRRHPIANELTQEHPLLLGLEIQYII